jgi:hypothetical protein
VSQTRLLIYGAGAIGRGYLPWVFPPDAFELAYVEADPVLQRRLRERERFTTHRAVAGYPQLEVPVAGCYAPGEQAAALKAADGVATAVGPRNVAALGASLRGLNIPVICFENDAQAPAILASATDNELVVFGIPDVITSNTSPPQLLEQDPLAVVTEVGTCFVDERAAAIGGDCRYVGPDELRKQWHAKLYIHNTPHAIAAYLGAVAGVEYLHEALSCPAIRAIVSGAMAEAEQMLVHRFALDAEFVRWYAEKELARFENALLFDPIGRVAREPFRKLAHNDRLIGAAELCLSSGVVPDNILLGIMAAFLYNREGDPDINIRPLRAALDPPDFLRMIIRLRPGEALFELLLERWLESIAALQELEA